jgi:hypothetical protein
MNGMNETRSDSVNRTVDASLGAGGGVLRKLSDFESLTGRLEAGGRVLDAYELECQAGDLVRLRLTSEEFPVVAFVVFAACRDGSTHEPYTRRVTGGTEQSTGGVEAQAPIALPLAGTYRLVVTSLDNEEFQRPVTSGEYRMTLLVDTAAIAPGPTVSSARMASASAAPDVTGPGSQKGARFSAWESDSL